MLIWINFQPNDNIVGLNLNPVQSQPVWSIVESRDSEWRSSDLIVRALQYFTAILNVYCALHVVLSDSLGSLEGVSSSGKPVDTAVTVQTTGETTVSTAADLPEKDNHHPPAPPPLTLTVRYPTPSTIPQNKQSEVFVLMELILSARRQARLDKTRRDSKRPHLAILMKARNYVDSARLLR